MTYILTFKAIKYFLEILLTYNVHFECYNLPDQKQYLLFTSLRGKDEPIKEKVTTTY